jgi:SAM-dependent methyltransferase
MGFDLYSTRFIVSAHRAGVDFSQTLTLGRQGLNLGKHELDSFLEKAGVKRNSDQRAAIAAGLPFADGLLKVMGAVELTSVDASPYEGATIIHDMNLPIPDSLAARFTLVIDFGTLEHIFNFPVAINNCMKLLRVGGSFLSATTANNYLGHGFYQFSPELFFRVFSKENGFCVDHIYLSEDKATKYWYEVPDPAVIKSRVELRNSLPTLMLVRARKVNDLTPFAINPQQSDYAQDLWQKEQIRATHYGSDNSIYRFAQRWAPDWAKNLRKGIYRFMKPPFSASYFKRVNSRLIQK